MTDVFHQRGCEVQQAALEFTDSRYANRFLQFRFRHLYRDLFGMIPAQLRGATGEIRIPDNTRDWVASASRHSSSAGATGTSIYGQSKNSARPRAARSSWVSGQATRHSCRDRRRSLVMRSTQHRRRGSACHSERGDGALLVTADRWSGGTDRSPGSGRFPWHHGAGSPWRRCPARGRLIATASYAALWARVRT